MCVIIYIEKGKEIDVEELQDAWYVNSDGAGFAVRKNGKILFERGFMTFDSYYKAIKKYIGKYDLLLHLRISTSNSVNRVQTHPYKVGNITLTKGETKKPVVCMNGVITGQKEYSECNDTMSYIVDHTETFMNLTQDILDIIEEATGAKWAVMKPEETLLSHGFVEEDGIWYSNKNHKTYSLYKYYYGYSEGKSFNKMFNKKMRKEIKRDKKLYSEVISLINNSCKYGDMCCYCTKCIEDCTTVQSLREEIDDKYYITYGY